MPAGGRTTEGRARQRNRNAVTANVMGLEKARSGATGISTTLELAERREWEEVAPHAQLVTRFMGQIVDGRMMPNRQWSATIQCPREYTPEIVEAIERTPAHFCWITIHAVDRSVHIPQDDEDADDADS